MKARVDVGRIARALRAQRRGKVSSGSGYFGAMQLAAEIQSRFRTPTGGGRATDPAWETKRLLPLKERTLKRLVQIARDIERRRHTRVEPMQVAAMLLERTLQNVTEEDTEDLARAGDD